MRSILQPDDENPEAAATPNQLEFAQATNDSRTKFINISVMSSV